MEMSKNKMEDLLCSVLNCGYADLNILADCEYPMYELVEYVQEIGDEVNINSLCYAMFNLAINDVQEAIEERLAEMEELLEDEDIAEEVKDEYRSAIESNLDIREDIDTFHNYIDSHAYLMNNKNQDIYLRLFSDELSIFEEKTGYQLQD